MIPHSTEIFSRKSRVFQTTKLFFSSSFAKSCLNRNLTQQDEVKDRLLWPLPQVLETEGIAESQSDNDTQNAQNNNVSSPGITLNRGQMEEIHGVIQKTVEEKLSAVASQAAKTGIDLTSGQTAATPTLANL